ncbi:hypothetical protein H9I45_09780 [Polaribacter haliotis]|uniref:Outer membrane protein beta-barrel domain-containing protein n=1 Tax=Polaribacter haliotis TaxID=1888915 RepID=A0A7L8ACL5_9FLAO|nr:hypothetical protein [Polaribacter haliotis]QOD59647.1 hypothetical protein H9I45_09780 [Polaribacter haliotis]
MRINFNFVLLFFLTFSIGTIAQNKQNKWTAGVSIAGAKYSLDAGRVVGGQLANQSPRLNISRYIFKGLVLDAGFATAVGDKQKYTTFDGTLRYDFGTSIDNVVPYVLLGGSFISATKLTPTLNFGGGATFWFTQQYGMNLQVMYKFSESKFESQKSHVYPSIGFVYSFGFRSLNPRLWEL